MVKNQVLAALALIIGLCAINIDVLKEYITYAEIQFLLDEFFLLPLMFILIALVIFKNHFIAGYTDEFLPFQLSILSLALAIFGLIFFNRLLVLGLLLLIASAYWSKKNIEQYY